MKWLLFGLVAAFAANPAGPVWPDKFSAQWNDVSFWTAAHSSSGQLDYSWNGGVHPTLHWHWIDGWAEPYCWQSLPMPWDVQCEHFVVNGQRFLYYQYLNECCMCCDDSQGCGVPPPDFMQNSAYQGTVTYLGRSLYSWNFNNQFNYLETVDASPTNRDWAELISTPSNFTNVWAFTPSVDPSVFALPAICTPVRACPAGPCLTRRTNNCTNEPIYFF